MENTNRELLHADPLLRPPEPKYAPKHLGGGQASIVFDCLALMHDSAMLMRDTRCEQRRKEAPAAPSPGPNPVVKDIHLI
jgi:hypothetical protein